MTVPEPGGIDPRPWLAGLSASRLPGLLPWTPGSPANLPAVRQRHVIFMTYAGRSPSTRNVGALERLARTIHPELFGN